ETKIIISGHDEVMYDTKLIKSNLEYLEELTVGKVDRSNFTKKHRGIHYLNVSRLGEMMKDAEDFEKARMYYEETLELLEEVEKTLEIEAKIAEISKILKEIV
ncbi:MAG: hypothetical protein GOP50_03160, partial [Candidatus Heimdallarchaeota archaeon]|nr:hypothetical protein [Candidatus Heimdallarchaeota archaeon]